MALPLPIFAILEQQNQPPTKKKQNLPRTNAEQKSIILPRVFSKAVFSKAMPFSISLEMLHDVAHKASGLATLSMACVRAISSGPWQFNVEEKMSVKVAPFLCLLAFK